MMGAEDQFSDVVLEYFKEQLASSRWARSMTVAAKVKILKDFTVGRVEAEWKLIAGVQQQDIVFYRERDSISYYDFKADAMLDIGKYRNAPIHIPLAVVELKVGGKHMNTHELITYSSISTQLKQVFPHCRYCLLMQTNVRGFRQPTFLRHCKGFDRVFVGWQDKKTPLWAYIKDHFKYLEESGIIDPA